MESFGMEETLSRRNLLGDPLEAAGYSSGNRMLSSLRE